MPKTRDWLALSVKGGACLCLMAGLLLLVKPSPAYAQGGVVVSIGAPDGDIATGSDFIARVNISEVTDFDAAGYDIVFAPAVLDLTSAGNGDIGGTTIPVVVFNPLEAGRVRLVNNVTGTPGVTGTGYLAELHFHAVGSGNGSITLENGSLADIIPPDYAIEEVTWVGDSVTILGAPPPTGDGGGPPTYYLEANLFGIEGRFLINGEGKILRTIETTSEDGMLAITIPTGTIALSKDGRRLKSLQTAVDESPPAPPTDARIIGLAYNLGPPGAIFAPPLTLEYTYDPDALPEGVDEEDLVLAYYDEATGEWVELDCVVDTENNTITASVAHFTTFAIIGTVTPPAPPAPAAFSVTNLSVTPLEVEPSETVTITVLVANTGGEAGGYQVNLVINDLVEATIEVTVRAGLSKEVTFGVTKEEVGSYTVTVNGLSGSFTVVALPVGPPPEPAAFSVSNLTIHPAEVQPKEAVTLTVSVANTGGWVGSYTIVLKINGVKEAEKRVTVAPSDTEAVAFSVTREEAGNYTVAVDGLSGSFTVLLPAAGVNWPVVGGIIAGVIVVGLVIYFLVVRRRTAWLLEKFWKI